MTKIRVKEKDRITKKMDPTTILNVNPSLRRPRPRPAAARASPIIRIGVIIEDLILNRPLKVKTTTLQNKNGKKKINKVPSY